jgi:hypothetical protein
VLGIEDIAQRIWDNLVSRPSGPFALRFLLQPTTATIVAIRDGLRDARTGRSPYLWTVLTDPTKRRGRLREGFAATGKIIVLAFALDVIYQFVEFKTFYPGEAIVVAVFLAFVPYLLIRGPAARIARRLSGRRTADKSR